jgi:3-oxoacyl-[acyl-carrier-protein] synthase-3
LNFAGKEISSVDKFLIHQANGFILQTIARKMKITMEKIPVNIDRFGNTSSASIPLLMSTEFHSTEFHSTEFHSTEFHQKAISGNILLSGFGSGLSWGSMVQETDGISVCSLTEI